MFILFIFSLPLLQSNVHSCQDFDSVMEEACCITDSQVQGGQQREHLTSEAFIILKFLSKSLFFKLLIFEYICILKELHFLTFKDYLC